MNIVTPIVVPVRGAMNRGSVSDYQLGILLLSIAVAIVWCILCFHISDKIERNFGFDFATIYLLSVIVFPALVFGLILVL